MTVALRDVLEAVAAGELTEEQAAPLVRGLLDPEPVRQYPLSRGQAALWAIHQNAPGTTSYNLPLALRLRADVDLDRLERSLAALVRRHPALRVNVGLHQGRLVQTIADRELTVARIDLRGGDLITRVRELVDQPFDLEHDPLYRVYFAETADGPLLLLVFHHLITDGVSSHLLLRDIVAGYDGADLGEPGTPYAEFVAWQEKLLAGPEGERHRAHWLQALAGLSSTPVIERLADHRRTGESAYTGRSIQLDVPAADWNRVKEIAARLGLTPFSVVFGLFASLLHEHSGERDICVLVPTDGRPEHRFDRTVGYLINPVVLHATCGPELTQGELFAQVQDRFLTAEDHSALPFAVVVDELRRAGAPETAFTIGFYLQQGVGKDLDMAAGQTLFTSALPMTQEGESDLVVEVVVRDEGALIHFKYDPELFEPATAQRLAQQYRDSLGAVDPTRRSRPGTAVDLVLEQAARTPDAPAITDARTTLTYAELATRVEALAAHLRERHAPGSLIGVRLDRHADLVVALLGVVRAGCAYVPLDPGFPADRLDFIVADAGAATVLTATEMSEVDWKRPAAPGETGELAYVLYTSGSTGKPKGVEIGHEALVNFLTSMAAEPGCGPGDELLAVTTVGFDIAGLELLLPLTVGARVRIVPTEVARDGVALAELLEATNPTLVQATPATWQMLLAAGWTRPIRGKILCGGEALTPELAAQLLSRGDEVWNLYGPTETTIWSSVRRVREGEPITVGRPIANTTFHLLDEQGHPVPTGERGELYIGGLGVARGYHDRPELTAEKFVPDTFAGHGKLFRTGDAGRFRPDGELELLGRVDRQVKVRGHRVELGEIEAALRKTGLIDEARVLLREDFAGHQGLVGFVTSRTSGEHWETELRHRVAEWLPEYMIPSRLVRLDRFPQTPNAKIDLKPLQHLPIDELVTVYTGQTRDFGDGLRALVAEIAGVPVAEIAVDRPLGDYGFDSIRFTQLSVGLRRQYDLVVPPTTFYGHPSIAELAAHLGAQRPAAVTTTPVEPAKDVSGYPPVAIVGIGGRLPDSDTLDEFWAQLAAGRDFVRPYPLERGFSRSLFARHGGSAHDYRGSYLRDVEGFDASLFRISPREAAQMDPQHRLLLHAAREAIQDAGYPPAALTGSKTGVFVGLSGADYFSLLGHERETDDHFLVGNVASIASNRISYLFDFHGQSATYDTACSSSMVAIHRAARALQLGDCEAALAGGANLLLSPYGFSGLRRAGMLSPDGRCKTFDSRADGYGRGEGVVLLMLKLLDRARADGDPVHGVLIGSAENHGGRTHSLTVPSPRAQGEVVAAAHRAAGVSPASIGFIETHGTGTQLGDPIEINGLKEAFGTLLGEWGLPASAARIALGSVKSNIGHLEASAGVAGVVKVLLAMRHRTLPGLVDLTEPNPMIELSGSPFELQRATTPWTPRFGEDGTPLPRRAGVSSFGMGGSNVHVVLEEAGR
ncbi:amino acid adenylation domain-containing protein [Amycolatopsis magusensis]|uniref:amino acid adenylation domain-containing protein n=1 Tax=Amycolatopsis magusensis TaxID=882444 RepID=UPI003C2D70FA